MQLVILWALCPWPLVFVKLQTVQKSDGALCLPAAIKPKFLIGIFFLRKLESGELLMQLICVSPRQCKEKMFFKSPEDMSAEIDHSAMYPCSILAISGG